MTDVVERLRLFPPMGHHWPGIDELIKEAADEIDRQAAKIECCEEMLRGSDRLAAEAQAEIERQAAEIEELSRKLGECDGGFDSSTKIIESQKAEIERLRSYEQAASNLSGEVTAMGQEIERLREALIAALKIECCEVVERLNHIEQKLDMMVNIICACDDAFRGLYVQEYAGLSNRLALEQKGQHSRASEASED